MGKRKFCTAIFRRNTQKCSVDSAECELLLICRASYQPVESRFLFRTAQEQVVRARDPWQFLLQSLSYVWALLIDSLMAICAFAIMGLAALVVHKSVEKVQLWGVPSILIEGMQVLHTCVWAIDALAVLWLCGAAAINFCKDVTRG